MVHDEPNASDRVAIPVGIADTKSGPIESTDRIERGTDEGKLSGAWFADGDGGDPGESGAVSLARARDFVDPGDSYLDDDLPAQRSLVKPFAIAGAVALALILGVLLLGGGKSDSKKSAAEPIAAAVVVDAGVEPSAVDAAVIIDAAVAAVPPKNDPPKNDPPKNGSGSGSGSSRRTLDDPFPGSGSGSGSGSGTAEPVTNPGDETAAMAEFYAKAGDAALRSGDPVSAASNYSKALAANPKNIDAVIGLGDVALSQGQYGPAITQLKKASKLAPRRARIYTLLGEAYLNSGNAVAAEASFKKALTLDPDDARARNGYNEAAGRLPPPTDDP